MMRPSKELLDIYLHVNPVDFRKSISGLSLIVEQDLSLDPFAATLYVFINRQRNKLKILYWEKNGFCLWYKRLEKDKFKWPRRDSSVTVTVTGEELNWLLDGFDLWQNRPHSALQFTSVG